MLVAASLVSLVVCVGKCIKQKQNKAATLDEHMLMLEGFI
jgi:hypothetical protein